MSPTCFLSSLALAASFACAQGIMIPPPASTTPPVAPAPATQTPTASPVETPPSPSRATRIPSPVEVLRREAGKLQPLARSEDTRRFILATTWLPHPEPTLVYEKAGDPSKPWFDAASKRTYLSEAQWASLPKDAQPAFEQKTYDGYFFYTTRYGSPMAYLRPLDVLAQAITERAATPEESRNPLRGKKILDYGFGTYGHLRLLASIGCFVTGVEVDELLRVLYDRPEYLGEIAPSGIDERKPGPGSLSLVFGTWPGDDDIRAQVGSGYDIFISKNTLKRGYIIPEQEVDPRRLVHLGVERDAFVRALSDVLKPGGYALLYNISPKPAPEGETYKPWADGRSPFEREMYESAGFEVIALDADDTPAMRDVGKALGWDAGNEPMDLENDFVVLYTLVRKKP